MRNKKTWRKISSQTIHRNPWFSLKQDNVIRPDGKKGEYYYLNAVPSVFIVPLTTQNEIYLVKQYRYPTQSHSWELPGGGGTRNETILASAKRELLEETGLSAKKWKYINKLYTQNGISNHAVYIYLATDLQHTRSTKIHAEGIEEVKKVPFEKAFSMVRTGDIQDVQTISALLCAAERLGICK